MRAAKIDANQPEIIAALRKVGASVQPLHMVGDGCVDLLVGFRARNHCLEVKDGTKSPSARELTADQIRWHMEWRGHAQVVTSIDEALAAIGAIK